MGRPKALIPIEGTTLLERTVQTARCITEDILLIGEPAFAVPATVSTVPILRDLHAGIGPVGGLETMLSELVGQSCLLLACDMPKLSEALLRRIASAAGDFDAAVCRTAGRRHPCCGLYRPSVLPYLQSAVEAGRFSMMTLLDELRIMAIDLTGEDARAVENWNEPSDIRPPLNSKDT